MSLNEFINKLKESNINYTEEMIEKLDIYYNFLIEYNKHTNLTTITNKEDVYLKHFYDSLTITKAIDLNAKNTLLDIGSGAGFPGIVLKIFFPHLIVTILDSNNKKTTFLKQLVDRLNLQNINIINERAEEYAKKGYKFDVVTSRAVAYIDIIITLSSYYINKEGIILLMKGDISEEEKVLKKHLGELNINNYSVINCDLSKKDIRNIIVVKINNDNKKILNYSQILKRHAKWINK